jgi:UPF0271 protein
MAKRCYVLDATALIQGLSPTALEGQDLFTVPEVVEEVREGQISAIRMEAAISSRRLKKRRPSRRAIEAVGDAVRALGEGPALSDTDLALLALSLDLRMEGRDVAMMSDDYAIQNVAVRLKIPFIAVSSSGIAQAFTWSLFCTACRRFYPPSRRTTCPHCGSTLRRRVVGRDRLRATGRA